MKTDRKDARKLATLHQSGQLNFINIPTVQDEDVRDYVRAREDVRQDQSRARQQLGKFLLRKGYLYDGSAWTQRHDKWLRSLDFRSKIEENTFDAYLARVREQTEKLHEMDRVIEELSTCEPYAERVAKLRCFRGIDTLTAMNFVAEVGDFSRFPSANSFMSFLGITPSEHSSGGHRRQGAITKSGNKQLRRLLIEASWHYKHKPVVAGKVRKRREGQPQESLRVADKAMKRLYKKYHKLTDKGKEKKVAIVAVARELAGFIWGAMVENPA